MSRTVLLVCGSRSLATTADAEAWTRAHIETAIGALRPGDVVLTGAAFGPDTWARQVALRARLVVTEFVADGLRIDWHPHLSDNHRPTRSRWCEGAPDPDPKMAPLVRNLAMLDALTTAQGRGWSVSVFGLVDARSRTGGTAHTLRHAERRGIEVQREVWPPAEPPA